MKKKNIKIMAACLGVMITMTGCGNRIPDMTAEQVQAIGEYAAVTLLKFDVKHKSRLVDASVVEAEEKRQQQLAEKLKATPTPQPSAQGKDSVEDTPIVGEQTGNAGAASMEEYLGLPAGMTITYREQQICDSYPSDGSTNDYFALDATEGKKLLVLTFDVNNQTDSEQQIDILGKNSFFHITVNDTYTRNALTTMLMNDLSTYKGSIPAGSAQEMVLLIEVDADIADNLSTISMRMKNESNEYIIQLL